MPRTAWRSLTHGAIPEIQTVSDVLETSDGHYDVKFKVSLHQDVIAYAKVSRDSTRGVLDSWCVPVMSVFDRCAGHCPGH